MIEKLLSISSIKVKRQFYDMVKIAQMIKMEIEEKKIRQRG